MSSISGVVLTQFRFVRRDVITLRWVGGGRGRVVLGVGRSYTVGVWCVCDRSHGKEVVREYEHSEESVTLPLLPFFCLRLHRTPL